MVEVIEPNQAEIVVLLVQNRQLNAKHFFVPGRACNGHLVVGDYESASLRWRKVTQDDYRDFSHGELLGGQ